MAGDTDQGGLGQYFQLMAASHHSIGDRDTVEVLVRS